MTIAETQSYPTQSKGFPNESALIGVNRFLNAYFLQPPPSELFPSQQSPILFF